MMRKTIRYATFLIPLLILVLYLLKERSPFGERNTSFAISPKNEITGIEFSDNRNKLDLQKKGDNWIVNKRYETRKSSILFILEILTRIEIKSPVAPELFKSEIVEKGIEPVRVKVSEKGRTLRSFLVYKTPSNTYGNIMKLKESSKPYIVYVPGNEVEIGSAFTLDELFWQPYTVFDLLPSEISSVALENFADSAASFRIENRDLSFRLYGPSAELFGWDTSRLTRYLSYFTHVPFESWAFDLLPNEKGRILKDKPLFRITVTVPAGETDILVLFRKTVNENGIKKSDTDRLWGKKDGGDELFIVRYVDIDPLLKKLSYFFPE